ncbi:fungal fucose-specific lectin protein [Diplodia corticola]|uniref:Fungal fucose-specific lectin protein n=1 Tax=Diplodia corticola TaxID=236234 RepID=A0A1J9R8Y6_9PEZI|nr:fungal fucose-specific lectin protein [Diplodia corticola]OJD38022.1 fungal fucose-specific lectin protein [Diplodia corticola]
MEQRERPVHDYSTLEVDQGAPLPELDDSHNLPQVIPNGDLPEVRPSGNSPEVLDKHEAPGASGASTNKSKICCLRRKTFWLVLSVVLLVAVAVAVGVGVGASRKHGKTEERNKPNNGATGRGNSTDSTPKAGRIASFSRLAAVNYTDRQNRDHSQVYYQDNNLDIWLADLDTTAQTWNLTKTNTTGMDPKNGTAISANNWPWPSGAQRYDFHTRFISASNKIRAVYVKESLLTNPWKHFVVADNIWQATPDSSLVVHGGDCGSSFCDGTEFVVFRSANKGDPIAAAYPHVKLGFESILPDDDDMVVADNGTALAKAPIPALAWRNDTFPRVAVYISANNGSLKEVYYATGRSWNVTDMSVPNMTLDAGSQMTAMSYIDDDGLLYVQVLVTRAGGGVMVAYLDGAPESNGWASNESVAGMESVLPFSPIAASQMGRVYALEQGDDGPELAEWIRTSKIGIPTFKRVGVVNTTIV